MSSDLAVVNEALVRLGVPPIASFSESSAQALTAQTVFKNVVRELTADHPWYFALREVTLPKLNLSESDTRFSGYEHVYQMPSDSVRVLGLKSLDRFQLAGDQLYTNDDPAQLVYVRERNAEAWPPHFRKLVVLELAAAFAMTLTDNSGRATLFYNEANRYRPRCRALDSQQTPPQVFDLMRLYIRRTNNPLGQA